MGSRVRRQQPQPRVARKERKVYGTKAGVDKAVEKMWIAVAAVARWLANTATTQSCQPTESKSLHLPKIGSPARISKHAKRQWMQQCYRDGKARSGFEEWNGSDTHAETLYGEAKSKRRQTSGLQPP